MSFLPAQLSLILNSHHPVCLITMLHNIFQMFDAILLNVHTIQNKMLDLVYVFYCPQDQEQSTPLHAASYLGDAHTMDLLIASGEVNRNAITYLYVCVLFFDFFFCLFLQISTKLHAGSKHNCNSTKNSKGKM